MDLCLLKKDVKLQLTNYGLVQDVSGTHRVFGDASEALTILTQIVNHTHALTMLVGQ